MTKVTTTANIADPDGFYAKLIDLHDGLAEDESATLNARLLLILANHIGDRAVLDEAMAMAARS